MTDPETSESLSPGKRRGTIAMLVVIGRQESGRRRAPGMRARSSKRPPGTRQAVPWRGGGRDLLGVGA